MLPHNLSYNISMDMQLTPDQIEKLHSALEMANLAVVKLAESLISAFAEAGKSMNLYFGSDNWQRILDQIGQIQGQFDDERPAPSLPKVRRVIKKERFRYNSKGYPLHY